MKTIWKYHDLLPSIKEDFRFTLGEGNTPLVRSKRLGPALGLKNLFFKLEHTNPTGSYKDRFAAVAISKLLQDRKKICLATTSGNTGSAIAAYCSAADIACYISVVDGAPEGKVNQMRAYGANVITIKDCGLISKVSEDVTKMLNQVAHSQGIEVQISAYHFCPTGMAGVQTISYELAEDLPFKDIQVFSPAGGGGLTLAVAKGFEQWSKHYKNLGSVKVNCVQPEGNDTIASQLRSGSKEAKGLDKTSTKISGLQVSRVIDGNEVIKYCREMGGKGFAVSDDLILKCQADLATKEGIFCEPAGATSLAGLIQGLKRGEINKEDYLVCLITGHGFKDPISAKHLALRSVSKRFNNVEESYYFLSSEIKNL